MTAPRPAIPLAGRGWGGGGATDLERALTGTPGVLDASVNPATETACVRYDSDVITREELVRAIQHAGVRVLAPPRFFEAGGSLASAAPR